MSMLGGLGRLGIASVGCFAASYIGYQIYRRESSQANIKGEPYVVQAMGILQGYDVVMERLGSPLKMHHISYDPNDNKVDVLDGKAKMKIPLTGSKGSSAYLYLWATRPPVTMDTPRKDIPEWTVNQLDIELGPTYRWTFYVNKDQLDNDKIGFVDAQIPDDLPTNPS
ncbi:cytochrome c oxidase assembly factor 1 homolog [Mizuhopecten yessoensis]|uniref:Cytochrome c oxidase assembly factor 1-like n=1 Tax=Mizuhopecten yessoensis TaxID=6573 RepID=A0A210Q688_MIZYE|nr:cytochrome c oxidase assembly factor 1 homolog [Mizuhopecten yessoensis]OWF44250.1 hypothetical protein KP79_PYT24119 [Mizuhopecten yessoensis]